MNGLEKPFRKKSDPKNRKTVKIKVKLSHVNKKPLARNHILVQTPFPHSPLKLANKFRAAKPLAFLLHFLFRSDQNHYSNLTSKNMKMCEQILKKKQRPSLNCKKHFVPNNSRYRFAAINHNLETLSLHLHLICSILELRFHQKLMLRLFSWPFRPKITRNGNLVQTKN